MVPIKDSIEGFKGDFVKDALKPHFDAAEDEYPPITKFDILSVRVEKLVNPLEFKVIRVETKTGSAKHCIVTTNTKIVCEGEPVWKGDED